MNEQSEQWIGLDVSKAHLDVLVHPQDQQWRSPNSALGITETIPIWSSLPVALVVLEATGGMAPAITTAWCPVGVAVVVSHPRRVSDFAKVIGKLAKTNRIDAHVLARYGKAAASGLAVSTRGRRRPVH